jgi:hypothetical protein
LRPFYASDDLAAILKLDAHVPLICRQAFAGRLHLFLGQGAKLIRGSICHRPTVTEDSLADGIEGDAVDAAGGVGEFEGAVVLIDEVGVAALETGL